MPEAPKRKRVTGLEVRELSFVDSPAVPKAKFIIIKRHGGDAVPNGFVPVEVIEKLCPPCGEKLRAKGFRAVKVSELKKQGFSPAAFCEKFGGEEGFRTRCMEEMTGVDDPGAFCNWLENECHATWEKTKKGTKCLKCGAEKARFMDEDECEEIYGRGRGYTGPRAGEDPIEYLQRSTSLAVALRHAYPESVRAAVLQLDDLLAAEAKKKREEPPKGQEGDMKPNDRKKPEADAPKGDAAKQEEPPVQCKEGMTWDPERQECVPMQKQECPDGMTWDSAKGECVPMEKQECEEGMTWDPAQGKCVPAKEAKKSAVGDLVLTPEQGAKVDALLASFRKPEPAKK